ncbi:hypothetical protein H5410_049344 [Solanum commersonii]|uniref:Uncharacterized protein n=1 Tax=Solanum commersonii TaxID=4109 RepID=A0A9J5WTW9_SOLCO|nr:hypothetical protein H5410_049344 [Solanum commersonii]
MSLDSWPWKLGKDYLRDVNLKTGHHWLVDELSPFWSTNLIFHRIIFFKIVASGDINNDITHRIGTARMERMLASGVLCDKKKMRMLRWIHGNTRSNKIRNEVILDKVGVTSVMDKMEEKRLRWFGHVKQRCTYAPVMRCERLVLVVMRRGSGRVKMH